MSSQSAIGNSLVSKHKSLYIDRRHPLMNTKKRFSIFLTVFVLAAGFIFQFWYDQITRTKKEMINQTGKSNRNDEIEGNSPPAAGRFPYPKEKKGQGQEHIVFSKISGPA